MVWIKTVFRRHWAMPPLNVLVDQYRVMEVQKRRNLDFTWAGGPHDSPVGTLGAAFRELAKLAALRR
jgi:hypothetical protein